MIHTKRIILLIPVLLCLMAFNYRSDFIEDHEIHFSVKQNLQDENIWSPPDNYLVRNNIKGQVKNINEACYTIEVVDNDTNWVMEYGSISSYPYGFGKTIFNFSANGNLTYKKWMSTGKDYENTLELDYSYNQENKITTLVLKSTLNKMSIDVENYHFKYDQQGRLIKKSWGKYGERIVYTYAGNCRTGIEWEAYHVNGKTVVHKRYKTVEIREDSLLRFAKYKRTNPIDENDFEYVRIDSSHRIIDNNDNQIKYKSFNEADSVDFSTIDKYNELGYPIIDIHDYKYKGQITSLKIGYQLDKHKNWTVRTVYENDMPIHITRRKIEYYTD